MNKTIRTAFKRGHICLISCLCGTALLNLMPLPCFGVVTSHSEPLVSIASTNEPLRKVLDKITKATGYQIEVTNGWENKSVSVNIEDLTLDESLRKVIKALGRPNNIIERFNNTKTVRIKFFNSSKVTSTTTSTENYAQLQTKQTEAMLNMEEPPTGEEQEQTENTMTEIDPDEIEVIPPENPGEKGITVGELKEMEANKKQVDSSEMEVIPPVIPE